MAYQQDFNDDEQKKGTEQVLSPESSSLPTAPGGSAAAAPAQPPKTGSGFTNLSQYVNANEPQSAGMAGKVVQGIDTQAGAATDAAGAFKTDLTNRVKDATVQDQGVVGNLATAPSVFNDKPWQDIFNKQITAYQGPKAAADEKPYTDISGQYQNLDQSVKNLDDQPGRSQLAQSTFGAGGRQYGQGENQLDTFLLGSGAGANVLHQAARGYKDKNFDKQWSDITSGLDNTIAQAKATSDATNKSTRDALTNASGNLSGKFAGYGTQLGQENAQKAQSFANIKDQLASPDAATRSEGYKALGIDPAQGEWLKSHGYDPTRLAAPSGNRSLGDLVSSDDVSSYNALKGLGGMQQEYTFDKSGNGVNPGVANQADLGNSKTGMDLEGLLKGRLADQQAARDQAYTPAQDAINIPLSARYQKSGFQGDEAATLSKALGMTPDDYQYAAQHGLLSPGLLKKGAALNIGDVATDADRQKFGQIMSSLGLNGDSSLQDTQNEGSPYSFDNAGLASNIAASRAEDARLAAAQADTKKTLDKAVVNEAKKVSPAETQPTRLQTNGGPVNPNPIDPAEQARQQALSAQFLPTTRTVSSALGGGTDLKPNTTQVAPVPGGITAAVNAAIQKALASQQNRH